MIIAYSFVALFISLVGYLVYFNIELRDEYINSPYNSKRHNMYQERVVKGEIYASDGELLASTVTDGEGNEHREYPYGRMFAHVVGYSDKGISGLEQSMHSQLLTSHGNIIESVESDLKGEKTMGDHITTTLDVDLQKAAYDALGDNKGAIVVMEPDTGRILAMVSKPDFDPNTIAQDWGAIHEDASSSRLVNRATQGQYPPGSTFKIVTSLAYWRQHNTFDDFHHECTGELEGGGFTIHCYNNHAHGSLDFPMALAKSCNTAFAKIGVDLDKEEYRQVAEELLFNKELPLDFPYRKSSFSLDKSTPKALVMQTAIGQGNTLVSPMHMAMITSAVANHGKMMKPYVVESIENYNDINVEKTEPKLYKQVMTDQEATLLSNMMQGVVEQGTASYLSGRGYTAAGKTGTAEHGNVDQTVPHSWFIGFSNVEDPDLVVSIIAEEAGTGSDGAVPMAAHIFDTYYSRQ